MVERFSASEAGIMRTIMAASCMISAILTISAALGASGRTMPVMPANRNLPRSNQTDSVCIEWSSAGTPAELVLTIQREIQAKICAPGEGSEQRHEMINAEPLRSYCSWLAAFDASGALLEPGCPLHSARMALCAPPVCSSSQHRFPFMRVQASRIPLRRRAST